MIRAAQTIKPKLGRCKECGAQYEKRTMRHVYCAPACLLSAKKKADEKRARCEYRERKEAMKTRSDYLKEAQAAFNAWIRWRDRSLPCVSCGRFHQGAYDAGHYRSVGSMPALRFDEDNCHRQCVPCNQHKSGNAIEYRIGLLARIGAARVERLEGPQPAAKHTIEELKAIKAKYRARLKAEMAAAKGGE